MIWTEEENDIRGLKNLLSHTTETCKSCQWCNHEIGEKYFTCGHHIANFTHFSWCSCWTSKNDPKVKEYYDKRKKRTER